MNITINYLTNLIKILDLIILDTFIFSFKMTKFYTIFKNLIKNIIFEYLNILYIAYFKYVFP
jgi:L-lactate permease